MHLFQFLLWKNYSSGLLVVPLIWILVHSKLHMSQGNKFLSSLTELILNKLALHQSIIVIVLTQGQCSKHQLLNSLRWLIYVINLFDNTKLPCYTLPPMQHHSYFRNLPPFYIYPSQHFIWWLCL